MTERYLIEPTAAEAGRCCYIVAAAGIRAVKGEEEATAAAIAAFAESLQATALHEGYASEVYLCPANKLTIGYGHRLLPGDPVSCDRAAARHWLISDMEKAAAGVLWNLRTWSGDNSVLARVESMGPRRWAGLLEMAFQLGPGGQRAFRKMGAAVIAEDWQTAAREALDSRWRTQTPKRAQRVAGLLRAA